MTNNKSITKVQPVITGTVVDKDAVLFIRPKSKAEQNRTAAENAGFLRTLVADRDKVSGSILSRLVLALVLNPVSSVDDKGRTVDALTALTSGDGAVSVPSAEVSKARAAHILVSKAGITSTDDKRWAAVLQITGRAGVGGERVVAGVKGKSAAKVSGILENVATASGGDKATAINEAFPRQGDGAPTGSKAFRIASGAIDRLSAAIDMPADKGGLDKAERKALADTLRTMADSLR